MLTVLALAVSAGGAAASEGSWGPWEPTFQGPITAPAGVVCPFSVTAEPVFERLRLRYHYSDAGVVDGYQVTGPLVARITNAATGVSVERNLSGLGAVTLNPDGSYDAVVNGNFLVFFLAVDDPANALLFFSGRTLLHGSAAGAKTLVSQTGPGENLCETLA